VLRAELLASSPRSFPTVDFGLSCEKRGKKKRIRKIINMQCIFCGQENAAVSIEHIVSESFGNKEYVAKKGSVCDKCNNSFSKFEGVALSNSIFVMERPRLGVSTKKGKNTKGKIDKLEIEGHEDFKRNHISAKGINDENFTEFDPATQTGKLFVKAFDKGEVACSKLLLKMALSSIYTSQRKLYKKYNFSELTAFLTNENQRDWPFLTSSYKNGEFKSIPRFNDKYELKRLPCTLQYFEVDKDTLLFRFTYSAITMIINVLNRNLDWIKEYLSKDSLAILYPDHYQRKIGGINTYAEREE